MAENITTIAAITANTTEITIDTIAITIGTKNIIVDIIVAMATIFSEG